MNGKLWLHTSFYVNTAAFLASFKKGEFLTFFWRGDFWNISVEGGGVKRKQIFQITSEKIIFSF